MKKHSFAGHLRDTTSILALSTAALLASSGVPAIAQATQGIYAGGSTLASLVFRQVFDCYSGATVGGDGVTFSTGLPGAGLLPTTCTVVSTVQGMVAGVGSGNGMRGYISNRPEQWYGGPNFRRPFSFTIATPFPAVQPPFVDSANATNFGSYPYPRLDISLSDAPLTIIWPATTLTTVPFSFSPATNWSTIGGAISQVTVNGTAVATYIPLLMASRSRFRRSRSTSRSRSTRPVSPSTRRSQARAPRQAPRPTKAPPSSSPQRRCARSSQAS
ncbi:hypothetical protein [Bradyrhizobium sp. Leo170]|uniref:hypothetical protein n=1 Tax=Bradyrhizobium sp. Leo170 TaxID=1571199 RepID=UPI002699D0E8